MLADELDEQTANSRTIKFVIVGDPGVGKTCLLYRIAKDTFPQADHPPPTLFDGYAPMIVKGGKSYQLSQFDTAGSAEYSSLRPISYPNTDVFLICFSVALVPSFEHLSTQWYPEITTYSPGTPTLLIGLQTDLRGTVEGAQVQTPQAEELAKRQGSVCYLECSSLSGEGVQEILDTIIEVYEGSGTQQCVAGHQGHSKSRPCCTLL